MFAPSWSDYATHDDSAYPELWDGCVGAWCPGIGPTGYSVVDLSGSRKHGTLTNTTPAAAWKVNQGWALDFDKNSSPSNHVQIGDAPYNISVVATSPYTWTAWFFIRSWTGISSYENMGLISVGTADYQAMSMIMYRKRFGCSGSTNGSSWTVGSNSGAYYPLFDADLNLGVWYHGAITRDVSGTYRGYVNGAYGRSQTITGSLILNNQTMKIGAHYALNETYDTDGFIDDVRFYSRCLTQEEIALLACQRAIAYQPRRPRRFYSFADVSNRRRRFFLGAAA